MRSLSIAVALLLATAATAHAQGRQTRPTDPSFGSPLMLEVAVRGYLAGGRAGSLAGDSGVDKLESYVWADQTLCGMGAGDNAPQSTPWVGWHFTANVVFSSPGQMSVRVEWQRLWENGSRVQNGPSGSNTLTLRSGERVELDRVAPSRSGSCGTVEAKLEAAVSVRPAYLMSGVAGGVATGAMSGVGRGGVGRGGGGGAGRGSGTAAGAASAAGGSGSVRGGRGTATGGGTTTSPSPEGYRGRSSFVFSNTLHDAEIWLVHKQPNGSEVVQQQSVRFSSIAKTFTFPPVQVAGRGGEITLEITGSLQLQPRFADGRFAFAGRGMIESVAAQRARSSAGRGAAGGGAVRTDTVTPPQDQTSPVVRISIARRARRATPFIDTRGTAEMSLLIERPGDVMSIELPPLQKETENLLSGHVFSIRLRVTPVK